MRQPFVSRNATTRKTYSFHFQTRLVCHIAALVALVFVFGNLRNADAQWRRTTPRDTFYIKANQFQPWVKGPYAPSCVTTKFYFSGTFGIFSSSDSSNFDVRYMYRDASWAAPLPLPNPPTWKAPNGVTTSFPVYLQISNNGSNPQNGDSLQVLEKSYQSNHQYTATYPGAGTYFYFRIYNRLDQHPDGYYYGLASGGITVRSAQFTAGISIQSSSLSFPTTNVGQATHLTDSIASFGLDPLQVDSIWIAGPQKNDFNVSSHLGPRFLLDSVSANAFTVTYSPSIPQVTSTAWLYLRCPNAECGQTIDSIALSGFSAAPNGKIGPDTLDFGSVRVGVPSFNEYANAFNSGNAPYIIRGITLVPNNGIFGFFINIPDTIWPESQGRIQFKFTPATSGPYQAIAYIDDNEGNRTPIVLLGNGGKPNVIATSSTLNFDTLFTGGTQVLYDTIINTGNWTARIDTVALGCANPNWYTFDPPDTSFLLDAGASRIYKITFHPQTTIDASLEACLQFFFDDGSQPLQIHLNGVEKQKKIEYDTNQIDFGRVQIGLSSTKAIGVRNLSQYGIATIVDTFSWKGIVFTETHPTFFVPGSDTANKLNFKFTPFQRGEVSNMFYILCSTGQYDSIRLYGYGALAAPVLTPPSIDFGTVKDAEANVRVSTLTDSGDYPLSICSFNFVGPDASEFSLVDTPKTPLTVQDSNLSSVSLVVNFTTYAHAGRLHTATLVIHFCDGSIDTLPLRAQEASNAVQFCWGGVDFGKIRVGTTKDTGVCFGNPEYIPLTVGTIWITPSTEPFVTKSDSLVVPKSGQSHDTVSFRPVTRGVFHAVLHAGGPGQGMIEDSIPITGIGAQSIPVLSSKLINFGKWPLNVTSTAQSLTDSNAGDWPAIASIEKIDDAANEFSVLLASGTSVDPTAVDTILVGGKSTYSLTFTPKASRLPDHRAHLIFHYDDGTIDTVTLVGKDRSDFLSFNRDTINFGTVRVGAAPASATVSLINTSDTALTASTLSIPAPPPFTVSNLAPGMTISSDDSNLVTVSFSPNVVGPVTDSIVGNGKSFQNSTGHRVVLEGIGAKPVQKLSVDTIFFDTVAWGRSIVKSFTLSNTGNWPLIATPYGPKLGGDFSPAFTSNDTIAPGSDSTYSVTFLASTPLQLTARVDSIVWTRDDGAKFKLVLIAYDQPPFAVHIGFPHAYWGRPGDKIAVELDLQNAVPDTLGIDSLNGIISFDPTLVNGPDVVVNGAVQPGSLLPTSNWTTTVAYHHGWFQYWIAGKSDTDVISKPGQLLTFLLQFQSNLKDGASAPLIDSPSLPGIVEAYAPIEQTTIFLDSVCGTIHLISGSSPIANYIEQNVPNPFGGIGSTTTLPFNVDADNTIVTIRMLNPTGTEILRPVDHQVFARGHYETTIDASQLPSGIYFYEFQANGEPPQMMKMSKE